MDDADNSEGKFVQFLMFIVAVLSMQASIFLSVSSGSIFLNLIPAVRKNWLLSFISFCGISLGYLVYLFCDNLSDAFSKISDFIKATKPYLIMLTTQFILTFISFIIFRKRFNNMGTSKLTTNDD
ncbi:hypothetical protein [Soonwooa sp.]|uniref:hypothetical protein n=1 Tax=Soonwooa sp. TaxID=1938592 RepID=UPI0028AE4940|nr:hypothetical protein [Soonwooa sp.]